ncbi:MAG: lipase family protein [Rhodospirillales bacterium]|nr:lipase family protein [Rhodospirillales bacterium]
MDHRWLQVADQLKDFAYDNNHPDYVKLPYFGWLKAEHFVLDSFRGFACETETAVLVSFRGSEISMETPDLLVTTVKNWMANLRFNQKERGGYRVHQGFYEELAPYMPGLASMILDLGGESKPVCLVGHSAGGALATLCGRFLHEGGLNVAEVFSFSSPRVGDRHFAESYPVLLRRIEHMHDIVPHLPLSPLLAPLQNALVVTFREAIEDWLGVPSERLMARNIEYVHAGELYYDDGDDLIFRVPHGEYIDRVFNITLEGIKRWLEEDESDFSEKAQRVMGCPAFALPMPAVPMDIGRSLNTAAAVKEQLCAGRCDFIRVDHFFSRSRTLLKRLSAQVGLAGAG